MLPDIKYQKIILAILILLAFGRSLNNGYSLDDENVTGEENSKVAKGFAGIKEILTTPYSKGFDGTDTFDYRPVTLITFAIEKGIFGFQPVLSHFINLLLYIAIVLIVFRVLRTLLEDYPAWIPFLVVAIFTLHPLHSEVVVSLKNREELLVTFFGFAALLLFLKYFEKKNITYAAGAILLMALGVNTKLSVSPFILFIPFTLGYFQKVSWQKSGLVFLSLVVFCSLAFFLPRSIFDEGDLVRNIDYIENPLNFMPLSARIPMVFYSFLIYVKLHLFPYPLISYYGYNEVEILGWGDYQVYVGLAIAGTLLLLLFKTYYKNKLLAFGLITFSVFLSPYLNFPFAVSGIIAERFAFNSALGISIILISFIYAVPLSGIERKLRPQNQRNILIVLGIILVTFIGINIDRTGDWKDHLTLLRADAKTTKDSFKVQLMYGDFAQVAFNKEKDNILRNQYAQEAINAYKRSIELYPQYGGIYNNLGVIYSTLGNYKKAIPYIKKAIELGEDKTENYFNLGACYEISGDPVNAIRYYEITLQKKPDYQPALDRIKVLKGH